MQTKPFTTVCVVGAGLMNVHNAIIPNAIMKKRETLPD